MRPSLRQGTMSHWGRGALSTHSSHLPPAASHVRHHCVSHCPSVLLRVPALTGQVTGTRHDSRSPAGPGQSEAAQALSALWSGFPWPELPAQGSETQEPGPGRKAQVRWTAARPTGFCSRSLAAAGPRLSFPYSMGSFKEGHAERASLSAGVKPPHTEWGGGHDRETE